MPVDLIQVPWDTARRGERMGAGPIRLMEAGAAERVRAVADSVRETVVGVEPEFPAEIATAFDLARATAFAVRTALGRGSFPLVLAGNCITSLGVRAPLPAGTGVVWLDAHGDLNTPETTTSGFLDGMALATLIGRCWSSLAAQVDGFAPVPEEHVLLVGARDLDAGEREMLDRSRILFAAPEVASGDGFAARLEALASRVERVYLHVDLDVHDAAHLRANRFAAPGGLSPDRVRSLVSEVAARIPVAAAAITAYDPAYDEDGRAAAAALDLIELIAGLR